MIRVSEHLRRTHSPDGGIVLDVQHGRMFSLNLVASRIVALLDRGYTPSVIAQEIAITFGVGVEIADRDVREFLAMLESHHLIETRVSGAML